MMKTKATQKFIKGKYENVICVPFCNLQTVLNYMSPKYYTTRTEGWASDVYEVTPDTAISTGYAPFGGWKISYDDCQAAEAMAIGKNENERMEILKELINHAIEK